VGNDGETLVADSSTSTGLRYTAGTVQANPVLNSAMQVWQRGTSVSIAGNAGGYVSDRWYCQSVATGSALTVSRQATSDTTNLPFIQYCSRVQRNSGQTATGNIIFSQSMETINSIPFAGKTVTMSFYARAGANYSAASNALNVYLISGTGTDQSRGSGNAYTGEAFPINAQTATLTTTWQRFTFTGTVGTTATELAFYSFYTPSGTAGANDYFEMTGCQIDIGSVALPFRTYAGTIQGELGACQRYYYEMAYSGAEPYGAGTANSTTNAIILTALPVSMRVVPTAVYTGTFRIEGGASKTGIAAASLSLNQAQNQQVLTAVTSSSLTTGWGFVMLANGSSAIKLSAEL
jgi:hypothetical protein